MTINIRVTGFQTAVDQLRQELEKFRGGNYVTVGIHEDAPAVEGGEELTMAQLGALLNFGSMDGKIPARPWLIPGLESVTPEILEDLQTSIANGLPLEQALDRIGAIAAGGVQEYMTDLKTPPNAPSTIAQKKSDNPLIDTGALRQSVTWKIQQGKPDEGIS